MQLVKDLVARISVLYPDEMPAPYTELLSNLSKYTSVAGYLQVTKSATLEDLKHFCEETLDLRATSNIEKLRNIEYELPAFWPNIVKILNFEKSNFLPDDLREIVLKLIEIRIDTFRNAEKRSGESRIQWEDEKDHQTMNYPATKLNNYLKNYSVNEKVDRDFCEKNYLKSRKFCHGIFSVGCCCNKNITMGYEILPEQEGAHNPFRFLETRELDHKKLEGVIYDHGCGLDNYILNREPEKYEYLRVLVDGSHWNSHKKMKKSEKQKCGHAGCSDGYNFNTYKPHLPEGVFSQGREQMHATMTKLVPSLRTMFYENFMHVLKMFFGISNLTSKNIL